eukprot:scaffold88472_cov39-Prasinocladus_malaysianus.AAC.1
MYPRRACIVYCSKTIKLFMLSQKSLDPGPQREGTAAPDQSTLYFEVSRSNNLFLSSRSELGLPPLNGHSDSAKLPHGRL